MKRWWRLGLALASTLCLAGADAARLPAASAQTSGSPVSLPPGPALVQKMHGVLTRAGSAHIDSTLTVSIPHSSRTVAAYQVDFSWKDSRLAGRSVTRTTSLRLRPVRTITSHTTTIIVGSREAVRSGSDAWICGSSAETLQALRSLLLSFLHVAPAGAVTVGAAVIDGVAVWHVRATAHIPFLSATPVDRPVDLYLAQADARVVEQTMVTTGTGQPTIDITVRNRYSRYGAAVPRSLPATCAASRE